MHSKFSSLFRANCRGCNLQILHRKLASSTTKLSDLATNVNIHEHRLKRPTKPPPSSQVNRWTGLQGLKERTQGSLIPDTIKEMEKNEEFQITAAKLKKFGQAKLTRDERKKRQRALDNLGIPSFQEFLQSQLQNRTKLVKKEIKTMQINIGLYCNQACNHCHVESSPKRTEVMDRDIADRCLYILDNSPNITTVDITGGAPELCPEFRYLVEGSRKLGKRVIDRCNLTATLEPEQEDLIDFLAYHEVNVVASLPCYSAKNVNMQRGSGVFDKSIQALLEFNRVGYGIPGSNLQLDLVYNPLGAFLPPPQDQLEKKYREELSQAFGIVFNNLFTMSNMPIKRFTDFLYRRNELQDYMHMLVRNFNIQTVENLMCRDLISINWEGLLFDCDFNQQLAINITKNLQNSPQNDATKETNRSKNYNEIQETVSMMSNGMTVWDIESTDELHEKEITNDNHCFGCTAGMGSS